MSEPGEPRSGQGDGRAAALAVALADLGLRASVRADGNLAIIAIGAPPAPEVPWVDAPVRRAIVAAARAHGFTHVALELPATDALGDAAPTTDAIVRRDQPAG